MISYYTISCDTMIYININIIQYVIIFYCLQYHIIQYHDIPTIIYHLIQYQAIQSRIIWNNIIHFHITRYKYTVVFNPKLWVTWLSVQTVSTYCLNQKFHFWMNITYRQYFQYFDIVDAFEWKLHDWLRRGDWFWGLFCVIFCDFFSTVWWQVVELVFTADCVCTKCWLSNRSFLKP